MEEDRKVEAALGAFMREAFLLGQDEGALTDTTLLIESGILNSIRVLRVVEFVEDHFNVTMEPEDVRPETFENILSLAQLVRSRGGG